MSDDIKELARRYQEDVLSRNPRSIGLFPIPEYPELEAEKGMWAATLEAILTTLRYLAPATLLTLFWGQQSFLFTLIKNIDNAFRAIVFSSEEQKQEVLRWLAEAGPLKVEHLDTVWRHGWILCNVLDSSLPGACAGHPPTRLTLQHAQAIADHYLGVEPVFSRQELESNDSLNRHQEWKLATYLERIRQALAKITPPVSKPPSQRTSPESNQFTFDYVAKGSGLTVAQINHKMSFKIYPTSQQALDPGEVTILIKGPKDTYGMTVLPPILGKAQKIRQKLLGLHLKQTFTENALPITQGATYLRAYGKNDMNKTYFIPKTKYDIEIEVDKRQDHAKVWYTVKREGRYEISITSRGLCIVGSPFTVTATYNIIRILEKENFCLENGEEIDVVDVKNDRKVVLRIVDFVTEKMLLRENGTLEKISEAEAKLLMTTDVENERSCSVTEIHDHSYKSSRFNVIAQRILKINRVCKIFNDLMEDKRSKSIKKEQDNTKEKSVMCNRNKNYIPDIVNSTLCDSAMNPFILSADKYIVPENISVSIRTEKALLYNAEEDTRPAKESKCDVTSIEQVTNSRPSSPDSLEEKLSEEGEAEDDTVSIDRLTPLSSRNPFLSEYPEDFAVEKKLGTFVKSEYETNNLQNEETCDSSIKIIVDNNPSPVETNPFIKPVFDVYEPDVRFLERPKTPVYKIITGEISARVDSPYLDPKNAIITEDMLSNAFVNPFFVHQLQSTSHYDKLPTTDFIIGAPVSLPPTLKAHSPEPDMRNSMTECSEDKIQKMLHDESKLEDQISPSVFSTPVHTNVDKPRDQSTLLSSTFHSLDSDITDAIDISNASMSSDQFEPHKMENSQNNRDFSPRKDMWDSAYVSIDENNSSPDSNNNDNNIISDGLRKQKFSPNEKTYDSMNEEELANLGPAERELWKTCDALNETTKAHEEVKPYRWEIRRPMFTPIIEESDRSISSGIKDLSLKYDEADSVTVAFAEINDIYYDYFSNSDNIITSTTYEDQNLQRTEAQQTIETDDTGVESASETSADVMRQEIKQEGKISEVQANVTESVSVSQPLHVATNEESNAKLNTGEVQFGDRHHSNIVLEKKKYWDEKIRQIEEKTEETTRYLKKKRIAVKQLKHDSLSKRKGKQIIKNFLNAGEQQVKLTIQNNLNKSENGDLTNVIDQSTSCAEKKLVEKWRKFWDDKLESEQENVLNNYTLTTVSLDESKTLSQIHMKSESNLKPQYPLTMKQEMPEEEVFKAFETSPKRFFGTSRKRILNKIDTFLGKPVSAAESPTVEENVVSPDSGLVSSRISLFHNMSNTEPLPDARNKSFSMHTTNVRYSDNSIKSIEWPEIEENKAKQLSGESERIGEKNMNVCNVEKDVIAAAIKEKKTKMINKTFNASFDEVDSKTLNEQKSPNKVQSLTKPKKEHKTSHIEKYKKSPIALRKTSISKSDMDIFKKVPIETDDVLEKHKSYDELPKINVQNFISLYENVSKSSIEQRPVKRTIYRHASVDSQSLSSPISLSSCKEVKSPWPKSVWTTSSSSDSEKKSPVSSQSRLEMRSISTTPESTFADAEKKIDVPSHSRPEIRSISTTPESSEFTPMKPKRLNKTRLISESISIESVELKTDSETLDSEVPCKHKATMYVSLSDIELEIVESSRDQSSESSPERAGQPHIDYKNRFKQAKQYFQSLEELRQMKKPKKLNECQMLLMNKSEESLKNERQKRLKKKEKSHSMPSSEIAKIWNEMQESEKQVESTKLVKISEKFHVDDLFSDVMEGKLSRQGSLRGIPHKKAVLEAFRSMENVSDDKRNPYEMSTSQITTDFTSKTRVPSAQTYLNEYPYLPTTDPSKYHSRLDANASGLITLKELLDKKRRRNSVPDLRLNSKFTEDL